MMEDQERIEQAKRAVLGGSTDSEGKPETEKVRVWVKVDFSIPYLVEVEDRHNNQEIREKLLATDPSNWEAIPDFYENLGSSWKYFIEGMTDEQLEQNTEHPIEEVF